MIIEVDVMDLINRGRFYVSDASELQILLKDEYSNTQIIFSPAYDEMHDCAYIKVKVVL